MPTRASDRVTLAVVASPTYVRTYYLLQASNLAAPAVPTANPPASSWTTTEPTYTAGSTSTLYTVQLVAYGSAAFEYGTVQVSSAFEAAKQAYNLAQTANNGQAAVPRNLHGTAVPTTNSPTAPAGSVYFRHQTNTSGPVIATYSRVGTAWVETPVLIRAGQVQAGAIDGVDITGSRFRSTAENTTRFELLQDRMDFYTQANVRAGSMFGIQYANIEHLIGLGVPSTEATPLPYFGATFGKMSHQVAGADRDVGFYTNNAAIGGNLYSYGDIYARNLRDTENGLLLQAPIVGTPAQRDARHWTSSAEFRKLLADANVQWFNTDTKCLEQYFISVGDGGVAGKGAVTVSGWYPISGNLPAGRAWKSGGAHSFGFPNDNTLIGTGNVLWQTGGLVYQSSSDSWVLPHAGRYRFRADMMFSSSNGNITTTIRNHDTGEAYKVQFARPQGNHFERFDFEAKEVLAGGVRLRASVAGSSINAVCERNTWHVDVEYLGPPFV